MAAKQIYEKDLYAVLGVKKSDDNAVIKKQYRKLARELHPDKTKGDKKLEERFKEVSEAYEILSDEKKRGEYDEMRDAFKSGRMPGGGMPGGGNFKGNFNPNKSHFVGHDLKREIWGTIDSMFGLNVEEYGSDWDIEFKVLSVY